MNADIFILCSIETAFCKKKRNQFGLRIPTKDEIASGSLPTGGRKLFGWRIDSHSSSLEWSGLVGQVELSRPWSTITSGDEKKVAANESKLVTGESIK
ncbi:hypothetical protein T12_15930 [Trichinella patagoniensis]|uniref:Uncharacterized protein n=1 Tax=Trichinella patagoniensis TaxID=990121 RepID=A0A0V1A886_9BILA|nr:hypothetical protein T12_15930 [Trichinella patagoniensis]